MADKKASKYAKEVSTPPGRLGFHNLAKPDVGRQYSDGKYKGDLIFEEGTNIKPLAEVALSVAKEMWGDDITFDDINFAPFKDGDEMGKTDEDGNFIAYAGYPDTTFIRAKSKNRIKCISTEKDHQGEYLDYPPEDFYSGALVRFGVTASACMVGKNKCVNFYLNKVQFLEDRDKFGAGARPASEVFADWEPAEESSEVEEVEAVSIPKKKKRSPLMGEL